MQIINTQHREIILSKRDVTRAIDEYIRANVDDVEPTDNLNINISTDRTATASLYFVERETTALVKDQVVGQ